jgi:hypothetical protein
MAPGFRITCSEVRGINRQRRVELGAARLTEVRHRLTRKEIGLARPEAMQGLSRSWRRNRAGAKVFFELLNEELAGRGGIFFLFFA